jgi:hypothetical protein
MPLRAALRSEKNCKPYWHTATSNARSANGIATASPRSHATPGSRARAMASIVGLMSRPTTRPLLPLGDRVACHYAGATRPIQQTPARLGAAKSSRADTQGANMVGTM